METGTIQVEVFTSRGKIPVADATVLMSIPKEGGKEEVVALEVTNPSGFTKVITLPTPSIEESIEEGFGEVATLLTITVEHPSFVSQKLENVQVFPQVDSVLPVEMEPLSENESSLVEETEIFLPEQDL